MYNTVGIDVSKVKSIVTVLQPEGVVIHQPFDVPHTSQSLSELAKYLGSLDGDTKIAMECTGRYHELAISQLLDSKSKPIKDDVKDINLTLDNDILPRLQNIESCYTTTYNRLQKADSLL